MVIPILFALVKLFISRGGGGGGDSPIKVGKDVRRVQNLGWAQFPQKALSAYAWAKKCPKT